VTSPEADRRLSCREDVHARLELTNRAANIVEVSGVRKASQILSGNCFPAPDFTYSIGPRRFAPHGTTVLFDRALYTDGCGCCEDPKAKDCGGSCKVQETFQVVTNVGAVSAGAFSHTVVFSSECNECKATVASLSRACQPARMKQAER